MTKVSRSSNKLRQTIAWLKKNLQEILFFLAVGSLMYLGRCEVEMLTGPSAIQRTVEQLSTEEAAKKFTTVSFKVTPQGMTVTDNERK